MNMMDKAKGYVTGAKDAVAAGSMALREANTRRRVAEINAEQARLRAAAGQPVDPAAAVAASMAATRAERLAPPPVGLPRRPAPAGTMARPGVPVAQQLSGEDRAKYLREQEESALQRR